MVYGVKGSDKVIRPGRVRTLIDSYLEKKARKKIKSPNKTSGQEGIRLNQDTNTQRSIKPFFIDALIS